MSVRVRLTRVGSRKNPQWRVVVADQRSPRDGRIIESLGHYDPQTQPSTIVIDRERLAHWIERGAEPSNTVRKLMRAPNTVATTTTEVPLDSGEPPATASEDEEQPPGAAPSGAEAGPSGAEVPEGDAPDSGDQPAAEPDASAGAEAESA